MGELRADLAVDALEVRETHISWVFLHAERVYKVKKPVNFGFADFSTRELRHQACLAELKLNRRLAPDVYLDLVAVTRDKSGVHRLAAEGETVDWAVVMRRLRDEDRADVRLEQGQLGVEDVDLIAARIVEFHERAQVDSVHVEEAVRSMTENVEENFAQTEQGALRYLSVAELKELREAQLGFLRQHAGLLTKRVRTGRVREGHGDLKLEHFYLQTGQVEVLDCIEFNERFRWGDVCADIAFLSMDLCGHRRVDLAERLLDRYAAASNDYDLFRLVDFYEGYRAYTRGKIAYLMTLDQEASAIAREVAERTARRYFRLALASRRRTLLGPGLVAVCGSIASGKSTLAQRLSYELGGTVVSSDLTRKFLHQVSATTPLVGAAFSGSYGEEQNQRTYDELLARGRKVLESGRSVVLDASFRRERERRRARDLATSLGVPFWLVECTAPRAEIERRLTKRSQGASESDGRLEVLDAFLSGWENVTEIPAAQHLVVDTARPLEDNLRLLGEVLPVWPQQFTG